MGPAERQETLSKVNCVRCAIPRLRDARDAPETVAEALHVLYERRSEMPHITITYGKGLPLRHCKGCLACGPSERRHHL